MSLLFATITSFITMISQPSNDTIALRHLIREPKIKSKNPPALILLHGVGSNEQDLFSFASKLPDKFMVISARAPIVLGSNSFAWYQVDFSTGKPIYNIAQETKSRNILINFIEQVKATYALDGNEIYLCGFSQGAIMSYSVALTRPDLVKGIAVLSGRLLEEIKPEIKSTAKLQSLKVLISHVKNDNTLPFNYAKQALVYLKTLNINPTFKEYNTGHEINGEMLNDLINWLK
jgi:phospholipase/carboxylesterase